MSQIRKKLDKREQKEREEEIRQNPPDKGRPNLKLVSFFNPDSFSRADIDKINKELKEEGFELSLCEKRERYGDGVHSHVLEIWAKPENNEDYEGD
ncbi:hypothetical protein ES706_03133 [subsurface metagenome]